LPDLLAISAVDVPVLLIIGDSKIVTPEHAVAILRLPGDRVPRATRRPHAGQLHETRASSASGCFRRRSKQISDYTTTGLECVT
jgi:hypothetical protein